MKKIIVKSAFTCMFLLAVSISANAQGIPDPGDPDGVPIDGGISVLLAAGVGYGAKKIKDALKGNGEN